MKRSTALLIVGALVGQSFIWIDSPLATLGTPLFGLLAAAMCVLLLTGMALWVIEKR